MKERYEWLLAVVSLIAIYFGVVVNGFAFGTTLDDWRLWVTLILITLGSTGLVFVGRMDMYWELKNKKEKEHE